MSIEFLLNNTYTIFPVTEDSLNRTSNVFAHPLCDDMQYLSKSLNLKKYESERCLFKKKNSEQDARYGL